MRICEYVLNVFSLDSIKNLIRIGEVSNVFFNDKEIKTYSSSVNMLNKTLIRSGSISLKVEKEGHEPLYKIYGTKIPNEEYVDNYIMKHGKVPIALEIHYLKDFDVFESYRTFPAFNVKIRFWDIGDENEIL